MKINFCVSVPSISVRRFYTLLAESHKCDVGITTLDESDVVIMDSPTPDEIAMNFSVKRILRIIATQGSFGVKLRAVFF